MTDLRPRVGTAGKLRADAPDFAEPGNDLAILTAADDRVAASLFRAHAIDATAEPTIIDPEPQYLTMFIPVMDLSFLGQNGFAIIGDAALDLTGWAVGGGGDVNGDGIDDFIVGARNNDAAVQDAGAVFVIFGKIGGYQSIDLSNVAAADGFRILGATMTDLVGVSVASAGDINGDGFDDVIVGGWGVDQPNNRTNAGAAFVIFGHAGAFSEIRINAIPAGAGFRISGELFGDWAGNSVASAGDINGDGFDEIVIGAPAANFGNPSPGVTYVIFGKATGFSDIDLASLPAGVGFKVRGATTGDWAGWAVNGAGDVNGDGYDDFILGAQGRDANSKANSGSAYVIYGKAGGFTDLNLGTLSASDGRIFTGPEVDDFLGNSVSSAGDVNGDGYDDILIGAYGSDAGGTSSGSVYLQFGGATPFTVGIRIIGDLAGDRAGWSVAAAGDVNGDGLADFIIGARNQDSGGVDAGAAYVIYGKHWYWADIDLTNLALNDGFKIQGDLADDFAGASVSAAGDINHDGFGDLIVGAPQHDLGGDRSGAAFVLYGRASNLRASSSITLSYSSEYDVAAFRGAEGQAAGSSVSSAGDINGDGYDDFMIAVPRASFVMNGAPRNFSGGAYVMFGHGGDYPTLSLATSANFAIVGAAADSFNTSIAAAGDFNGDGYADMLYGDSSNADGGAGAGAAYVLFGHSGTFNSIDLAAIPAGAGFKIQGDVAGDRLGTSVASAGDFNGDGYDDIILGASRQDSGGTDAGAAYVIFGKASGFATIDLTSLSSADGFKIQGDMPSDYAGISVSSAGDLNGDGFDDLIIGANENDSGGSASGAAYVIFGRVVKPGTLDLGTLASADGFRIQGDASFFRTGRVAAAGDVNGDGIGDIVIGAPSGRRAYIIFGKTTGFGPIDLTNLPTSVGITISSSGTFNIFGHEVSAAGDVNGDGYDDVLISNPQFSGSDSFSGRAYVIYGKASGFTNFSVDSMTASQGFHITGGYADDSLGAVSAAGDVNGDGYEDILVGAGSALETGPGGASGLAYVIFGHPTVGSPPPTIWELNDLGSGGAMIKGDLAGDKAGTSVSSAGDINGDGYDDIMVAATDAETTGGTDSGAVYVLFGKAGGIGAIDLTNLAASAGFKISGAAEFNYTGFGIASAGDINRDGFADIVVSANLQDADGIDSGAAYVLFGKASGFGAVNLATLSPTAGFKIVGDVAGDRAAVSVSSAGDVNNDGFADIVIGANGNDAGGSEAGAAYVIFGKASGLETVDLTGLSSTVGFKIQGSGANALTGRSVSAAGDVNGDGFADVIVGANGFDNGSGAAYASSARPAALAPSTLAVSPRPTASCSRGR